MPGRRKKRRKGLLDLLGGLIPKRRGIRPGSKVRVGHRYSPPPTAPTRSQAASYLGRRK